MGAEFPFYASLALAAGPVLFARGLRDLGLRRAIQNTPTSRIRSMPMGRVEVSGTAVGRSTVAAPFSGRPCVYWQVEIGVRTRREGWSTVHRNASGHPFFVRDDTGLVLVYPEGAICRARITGEDAGLGIAIADTYASYMSRQRLMWRHLWRLSGMRFRERTITEGEPIYVMGEAQPRARAVSLSENDESLATGTDGPLRLPGASLRALHDQATAVIRRGRNGGPFVISQQREEGLCLDLGMGASLKLAAGPVLTLSGLAYWLYALPSLVARGTLP